MHVYPRNPLFSKHAALEDYVDNPKLYAAVQHLTDREKEVLKMVFVFDLKVTEIAKIMNVSHQAVSKTKLKALHKLRKYLQDSCQEEAI